MLEKNGVQCTRWTALSTCSTHQFEWHDRAIYGLGSHLAFL